MVEIKAGAVYRMRDGRVVGPMFATGNLSWPWGDNPDWGSSHHWKHDGMFGSKSLNDMDIVAECPVIIPFCDDPELPEHLRIDHIDAPSPVRTRTVTEIVAGRYGAVHVMATAMVPDCEKPDADPGFEVRIGVDASMNADELAAAGILFWRLAAALREMGKPS